MAQFKDASRLRIVKKTLRLHPLRTVQPDILTLIAETSKTYMKNETECAGDRYSGTRERQLSLSVDEVFRSRRVEIWPKTR
jgi:hypothetical protein